MAPATDTAPDTTMSTPATKIATPDTIMAHATNREPATAMYVNCEVNAA